MNAINHMHKPAILIVDDKPENLLVLEKLLSEAKVRLIRASSGNEALVTMLQENDLILVLLDVHMPDMDGYEVLEIMHSHEQLRKIPVILITAYYMEDSHRIKGYALGSIDYLYKPIEETILRGKVNIFLRMYEWREEIADLQRRNQLILDAAGEGIFGLDAAGQVNFINPAASTILGWRDKELLTQSVEVILPKEQNPSIFCWKKTTLYQSSLLKHGERVANQVFVKKDKTTVPVDYVITALHNAQGHYLGAVIVFTDATERITNERNLHLLQQSQKMETVGQLTGGIAHDFNNVLMIVQGNLELLLLHFPEETKEKQHIGAALRGVERGRALTKRLLSFSRQQTLFPKHIELTAQLQTTMELLKPTVGETIQLHLDCPNDLWCIWVDVNQFENALLNLAINARDAMPKGGSLIIKASNIQLDKAIILGKYQVDPGDYVKIDFTDTGVGMTTEVMNQIFEPFFTTKDELKGTGLGLSIIYGFMLQSKGGITVTSQIAHGTTFTLYFPKSKEKEQQTEACTSVNKSLRGKETVLIVEDEAIIRKVMADYLPTLGYTVLVAEHGIQALEIIKNRTHAIDLLLTDIVMPGGISGIDLVQQARIVLPHLKALLISGHPKSSLCNQASKEEYIMKPFKLEELAHHIRMTLGNSL